MGYLVSEAIRLVGGEAFVIKIRGNLKLESLKHVFNLASHRDSLPKPELLVMQNSEIWFPFGTPLL